jgi:hypothetical protein
MFLNSSTSLSMYLFCNSKIHVITLYLGHVCVYYASILRCWHLVWILVRTDHPCLGVGCHTKAWKPLLPTLAMSPTRDCRGGVGVLALTRLRYSMTLRRSSRSKPYSRMLKLWVMRQHTSLSARRRLPLIDEAASLQARLARSWLTTEGSCGELPTVHCAAMRFAALAPCWAKVIRG